MRILVCGDRNWVDKQLIYNTIKEINDEQQIDYIIEGEAKGADTLAREVALDLNIPVLKYPADWIRYGKGAGPIRNLEMLQDGHPNLILAFHDDFINSKGTRHMITLAEINNIRTRLVTH